MEDERPVLVIAEDHAKTLGELRESAEEEGFRVADCLNAEEAITAVDNYHASGALVGVLTDLKMEGTEGQTWGGWEVLSHAYRTSRELRLAAYTSFYGHEVTEIFESGAAIPAFTLFAKPKDIDRVVEWMGVVRSSWEDRLALALRDADTRRIYEKVAPIYARSSLEILLLGETGTGKESLARHIHEISGLTGPFIPVNCGGLEATLAFGELFGHTSGAFTDAQRHELGLVLRASGYQPGGVPDRNPVFVEWLKKGNPDLSEKDGLLTSAQAERSAGTLFLDEVTSLSPKVMAGLLRVLSSGDVAPFGHHGEGIQSYCRIIAATNEVDILRKALSDEVDGGVEFRRDLCFRLGGAVLVLSPLRQRDPADIEHFMNNSVWRQLRLEPLPIENAALEKVVDLYHGRSDAIALQYQKGNFRSLRNLAHRAALIARAESAGSITPDHIDIAIEHGQLETEQPDAIGWEQNIRERFRWALAKMDVELDREFSRHRLVEVTREHPTETARAFLECALVLRQPAGKDYDMQELERALTRGASRSAWIGKELTKENVRKVASEHYGIESCPEHIVHIVKLVRSAAHDSEHR